MSNAFIKIAPGNGVLLADSRENDFIFYTASSAQNVLIGVSNNNSTVSIRSNAIQLNNNVGIGVPNPKEKLHVDGGVQMKGLVFSL